MNQILINQKLYVTPELKKKKRKYKIQFIISIILVIALFSYYIYAEYDRNKSEEVSQDILASIDFEKDSTTISKDVIVVALDDSNEDEEDAGVNVDELIEETTKNKTKITYTSDNGITYQVDSILNIPSLGIKYPVLTESNDELLKISLNKFWGPEPNEVGNYCIVGHNYKSKRMFGKLSQIEDGAIVTLTDVGGRTLNYVVYDRYKVEPDDVACTSQLTNGKKELTLITCTNYGQDRLVIKAVEK